MLSRSRTSFSMSLNALPSAARKQTEPVPVAVKSADACSVIAADGTANSASRFGGTGLVRPSSVSRKPTAISLASCAELLGDLVQLAQALLQRRMRREDRRQAELPAPPGERGREVESIQRLGRPQVLRRDSGHVAGDLHQRAGQ